MEQKNKQVGENLAEASRKSESPGRKTAKSLKVKSKIAKSLVKNSVKTKKAKYNTKVQGNNVHGNNKEKNKSVLQRNKEGSSIGERNKELNVREDNQQKNATNNELIEKSEQIQANQEKIGVSDNLKQKQRSRGKSGGVAVRDGKRKAKGDDTEKKPQNKVGYGSEKNQKGKEKYDSMEKREQNEKKEKLGGLIFMCNAKTKPDCFRYRVMGVPPSKKDLVMGVKPGLKLFLYDFDLKLMYGIYKASSSGGIKLEPKAFGGSFPIQVRFNVHTDCYPLPESIFRKAIKENYNEKNKFKIELTGKQVRKLMELFRPASVYSTALPIHSPPVAAARDRQVYDGVKESLPYSDRELSGRDPYANERDQRIVRLEVASTPREQAPRDLYMSEKEYRAYGLKGERRNLTPQHHISPTLDPYQRDYERDYLLGHSDAVYRDTMPVQREVVRTDPLYLTEREYQTHDLGGRRELPSPVPPAIANASFTAAALDAYRRDPYHTYGYGVSSVDPYLPPVRREAYLSETDPLQRREIDQVDRSYSTYAANALSDYNRIHHYQETKPEVAPPPVSSRYSFAGPSFSFR